MDEKVDIQKLSQELIEKLKNDTQNIVFALKSTLIGHKYNFNSYNKYLNNLQKTLKKCTCQYSWSTEQIIVKCNDCQKSTDSCICVNCFFKGNHQNHNITLVHSKSGTCDCGDPLFWSPDGFCSDHPGPEPNPERTQLNKETRIKLIAISKVSLYFMNFFASKKKENVIEIIEFLTKIVSLGDATRRCVSLAFQDSFNYYELYSNCTELNKSEADKVHSFFGSLANDEVFREYFTFSFVNDLPKFISFNNDYALKDVSDDSRNAIKQLYNITFHATNDPIVYNLIKESKINLIEILSESICKLFNFNFIQMSRDYLNNADFYQSMLRISDLLKSLLEFYGNKSDEIIEFIIKIFNFFLSKEFSFPLIRVFGDKYDDPKKIQSAQFTNYFHMFHIINKISSRNIHTEKVLSSLSNFFKTTKFQTIDKNYEKKDENDCVYYHSVLDKNVQFAQSFASHIFAFLCLNLKDQKKLSDYINEVTDDTETFIRNWALLPLRFMAASYLEDFDFYVRNSDQTINALDSFKYMRNIKYKFAPTFNLLQTLLKATNNVDNFLLMVISTFGFFSIDKEENDFDDNQKRLILLTIFFFVSCLIFDTLCEERNFFTMRRLQIMTKLMDGNMTTEMINNCWYGRGLRDENFCDDLRSFASRVTTKNGTQFHLTDSSEWHPILPYISLNSIIPLIQKFIDKNPDSLINFPKLPSDSTRLLFSPSLWALEYFVLSNEWCKDYQIIHQLVFNVLIITSNNNNSEKKDDKIKDEVIHANDLKDLIFKSKNLTFGQFLRRKIIFMKNSKERSMIDLIGQFGNIGITVLSRMNLTDVNNNVFSEKNQQVKEKLKKKNHERAKALKMQIVGSFNQKQKSFQSQNSQQEDMIENNEKLECSICHLDNENDCFIYPAFIFKSPLSSYIKRRFLNNEKEELLNDRHYEVFNSVQICLHPIHSKCIHKGKYFCPTDRCPRNSSLPIIAGIYDYNPISSKSAFNSAQCFLKNAYFNDIKFAVYSLASQIELIEMRHRSNPGCLDNQIIEPTLRNIYLCIWHLMREETEKVLFEEEFLRKRRIIFKFIRNEIENDKADPDWLKLKQKIESTNQIKIPEINKKEEIETNVDRIMKIIIPQSAPVKGERIHLSPLMKYILYSTEDEVKLNMNDFINGKIMPLSIKDQKESDSVDDEFFTDTDILRDLSDDYQMLQFLRCVAIFDHFARCNKIAQNDNEFIDWDVILSSSYLRNHYKIQQNNKNEDFVLPMFSFIQLPKLFLSFIHPPYSAPILSKEEGDIYIDLLTGKMVDFEKNSKSYQNLYNFVHERFNDSFTILLSLNGAKSSRIIVYDAEFDTIATLRSIYTDKFGDQDIGIKRGSLLQLNESIRDEVIDNFLSGLWTNQFK